MPQDKKAPNLAAAVEKDLSSDLKKVGGFFKGIFQFTQRAEAAIEAAKQEPGHPESRSPRAAVGRGAPVVVEAASCDVCGGTGLVGGTKKIPCPECRK